MCVCVCVCVCVCGYSMESVKRDVDQGTIHIDMFALQSGGGEGEVGGGGGGVAVDGRGVGWCGCV